MTTITSTAFASPQAQLATSIDLNKQHGNTANAPIGVFDSGLGGLSVLAHLVDLLPQERYFYLADTLHVPYGLRGSEEIRQLTINAVDWLVDQGCKLVVVACNTASAHGLQAVRERYPSLPIVGLVPAIKPAVLRSQTKQISVLATPATLHGQLLNEVIEQVAMPHGVAVHKYSLVSLVPWVEAGMPGDHQAVHDLEHLLQQLMDKRVDQLVLGCTHYPFFKTYLQHKLSMMAPTGIPTQDATPDANYRLDLIDSGDAIAKRVVALLGRSGALRSASPLGATSLQFYTTADLASTTKVAKRLLQQFLPTVAVSFLAV